MSLKKNIDTNTPSLSLKNKTWILSFYPSTINILKLSLSKPQVLSLIKNISSLLSWFNDQMAALIPWHTASKLALLSSQSSTLLHTTPLSHMSSSQPQFHSSAPPNHRSSTPLPVNTGLNKVAEYAISKVYSLMNWARTGSMWPVTFGLAWCAVEMIQAGASRYDLDRYGGQNGPIPPFLEIFSKKTLFRK